MGPGVKKLCELEPAELQNGGSAVKIGCKEIR